jgi:hypothetical protein
LVVLAGLLVAAAAVALVVLLRQGPKPRPPAAPLTAPVAGGDWAAQIGLDSVGRRVLLRWVARKTGVISQLYVRVKVEGSECWPGRRGYAMGTAGIAEAVTYATLPGGLPDRSHELARVRVRPCERQQGESLGFPLGIHVHKGDELATVVRNVDPHPTGDFFSLNFLYARTGLLGANGRNERSPDAPDAFYGLDPREVVGFSRDGGAHWHVPGGPYGPADGRAFLPTYIQAYADGTRLGQPYYYGRPVHGPVSMVFLRVPVVWTIRAVGAYVPTRSTGEVMLSVDGRERARARLSGRGMLRASIAPVTVKPGSIVAISTRAGDGGLELSALYADAVWTHLMRLGRGYDFYLRRDPTLAVPVYPLPMYSGGRE